MDEVACKSLIKPQLILYKNILDYVTFKVGLQSTTGIHLKLVMPKNGWLFLFELKLLVIDYLYNRVIKKVFSLVWRHPNNTGCLIVFSHSSVPPPV